MTMKNEPVAVNGATIGVVTAILGALAAFGVWSPTEAQTGAIFGLLTAIVAVGAVWTRRQTYGPQTVADARLLPPCDVPPGPPV